MTYKTATIAMLIGVSVAGPASAATCMINDACKARESFSVHERAQVQRSSVWVEAASAAKSPVIVASREVRQDRPIFEKGSDRRSDRPDSPTTVPLPGALPLLLSGIAGFGFAASARGRKDKIATPARLRSQA